MNQKIIYILQKEVRFYFICNETFLMLKKYIISWCEDISSHRIMLIPSQETIKSLGEWHQYSVSEIALVLVICRNLHICKLFIFAVKVDKYLISHFKHAIGFEWIKTTSTYLWWFVTLGVIRENYSTQLQRILNKMDWLYDETNSTKLGDTTTTNQYVVTEIDPNVNN